MTEKGNGQEGGFGLSAQSFETTQNAAQRGGAELPPPEPISGRAYRRFMLTATLTALGIGLFFSLVLVLIVLFCVHVWL